MEREPSKKQETPDFNSLDIDEHMVYLEQAERLQELNHCTDVEVNDLAEKLYNAKWRNL